MNAAGIRKQPTYQAYDSRNKDIYVNNRVGGKWLDKAESNLNKSSDIQASGGNASSQPDIDK